MKETIKKHNAFFRQMIFLGILILMGIVMVQQLAFFLGAFLGAVTFYIVFRSLIFRMTERHGWPRWLAALVIVLVISVLLVAAMYGVFEIVAGEIQGIDTSVLVDTTNDFVPKINSWVGFDLISRESIAQYSSVLTSVANAAANTTYSFAANIFMTVILLYFMLANGRVLESKMVKYMPFGGESSAMLMEDVTSIIYSNAVGIPLTMLSQGLVAALIYWLFGVPSVVFWAFLTALCGLVPMVGTVIVSLPIGVWMIVQGDVWMGVGLLVCGVVVIANVDNLTRIVLNKKIANTHPLVVIFGVIMGIPLFGFWGIIFGPLMISLFLLLVEIYYKEYKLLADNPIPPSPPSEEAPVEEQK